MEIASARHDSLANRFQDTPTVLQMPGCDLPNMVYSMVSRLHVLLSAFQPSKDAPYYVE